MDRGSVEAVCGRLSAEKLLAKATSVRELAETAYGDLARFIREMASIARRALVSQSILFSR